jgi:hypothetical protein
MNKKQIIDKYNKHYGISMDTINAVYKHDKTPTKKYVGYILFQCVLRNENYTEVIYYCEQFETYLSQIKNKDIYSAEYKYFRYTKKIVDEAAHKCMMKQSEKDRGRQIFVLEETDDYILLQPRTFEASQKYGYGTKWCTTYTDNYFNNYKKYLVYLIYKNSTKFYPYNKLAFFCSKGKWSELEIFNPEDTTMSKDIMGVYVENHKHILKQVKHFIRRRKFAWWKSFIPNSYYNRDKLYIENN